MRLNARTADRLGAAEQPDAPEHCFEIPGDVLGLIGRHDWPDTGTHVDVYEQMRRYRIAPDRFLLNGAAYGFRRKALCGPRIIRLGLDELAPDAPLHVPLPLLLQSPSWFIRLDEFEVLNPALMFQLEVREGSVDQPHQKPLLPACGCEARRHRSVMQKPKRRRIDSRFFLQRGAFGAHAVGKRIGLPPVGEPS